MTEEPLGISETVSPQSSDKAVLKANEPNAPIRGTWVTRLHTFFRDNVIPLISLAISTSLSIATLYLTLFRADHVLWVVLDPSLIPYIKVATPSSASTGFSAKILFANQGNQAEAILTARLWIGQLKKDGEISGQYGDSLGPVVVEAGKAVSAVLILPPGEIAQALQFDRQGAIILETTVVAPNRKMMRKRQELYPAVYVEQRHSEVQLSPGIDRPYSILDCSTGSVRPDRSDKDSPQLELRNDCR